MSEHISPTWYEHFFTELPNEFWRRAASPEMTRADIDFLVDRLALKPASRILDVPCGSGRHSLALAARGHRITGLDISDEAITHARRAAADAGLDVTFKLADMRDLPRNGSFDAAVCMGNSFGYLDLAGTQEFVAALAAAVRPGGRLAIDFSVTAESVLPGYTGEPMTMRTGDIDVRIDTDYDVARSRLINRFHFTRGHDELTTTAVHHVYTSAHLAQMLTGAGFTDIARYAGPGRRAVSSCGPAG